METRLLRGLAALAGIAGCLLMPLITVRPALAATDPVSRVIELTNVERQKAGLAPLAPQTNLTQAAGAYAGLLAATGCFAHTCGPVPDFSQRLIQAGYSNWTGLAENIAAGQRTPEAVVEAWMNSAGHRANILNPAYTEIGVGLATGGSMGMYWAQEFGARRGVSAPAPAPVPATSISLPAGADGCIFQLGFATLRSMIGAAGGTCTENEHFNPANGNAEQRTTGGLFVWRKADNWTAFTDGYRTWLNGPQGLQSRLNVERFGWERDPL